MCSSTASSVCVRVINSSSSYSLYDGMVALAEWQQNRRISKLETRDIIIIIIINEDNIFPQCRGSGNSIKTFLCRFTSLKQIGYPEDNVTEGRWGQAGWDDRSYITSVDEIQTNKRWVIRIHRTRTYLKLNYTTDIILSRRVMASYSEYLHIAEGLVVEHNITTPRTSPILQSLPCDSNTGPDSTVCY